MRLCVLFASGRVICARVDHNLSRHELFSSDRVRSLRFFAVKQIGGLPKLRRTWQST